MTYYDKMRFIIHFGGFSCQEKLGCLLKIQLGVGFVEYKYSLLANIFDIIYKI
jgi:hypothetical protein